MGYLGSKKLERKGWVKDVNKVEVVEESSVSTVERDRKRGLNGTSRIEEARKTWLNGSKWNSKDRKWGFNGIV